VRVGSEQWGAGDPRPRPAAGTLHSPGARALRSLAARELLRVLWLAGRGISDSLSARPIPKATPLLRLPDRPVHLARAVRLPSPSARALRGLAERLLGEPLRVPPPRSLTVGPRPPPAMGLQTPVAPLPSQKL